MLSFLKCWASLRRTFSTFPPSQVQAYACSDVCCSQTHKLLINRILKYQNQYSFVLIQSMPYDLLHDSHDMRIFHEISERLFFTWIIIFSAPWLLFFLSLSLSTDRKFLLMMKNANINIFSSVIYYFHISHFNENSRYDWMTENKSGDHKFHAWKFHRFIALRIVEPNKYINSDGHAFVNCV